MIGSTFGVTDVLSIQVYINLYKLPDKGTDTIHTYIVKYATRLYYHWNHFIYVEYLLGSGTDATYMYLLRTVIIITDLPSTKPP